MKDWHETGTAGGKRGGVVAELSSVTSLSHVHPPHQGAEVGSDPTPEADLRSNPASRSQCAFVASDLAIRKLSQILELVRDLPGGAAIHRDAMQVLGDLQQSGSHAEQFFSELLDLLLHDQSRRLARDTDGRIEFELLRRQLRPPITGADETLRARLLGLLREHAHMPSGGSSSHATPADAGEPSAHTEPFAGSTLPPDAEPKPSTTDDRARRAPEREANPSAESHEAKIDGLQRSLGREIRETLSQNEEFGVTLDLVLSELQRAREIGDTQQIRERLLAQVKRLHKGHFALAQKLDSADRYLSLLSLDSRNLNEELHRVHELSLTDELTSLPNRRAFMARVEEEVVRVERYGMPLSLALIDLDRFKRINDEHGHAAGDEVLRCYATQIFSVFRNHDLVARYGGEEFAVLLPNTDHGGAAAALRKARECAAQVRGRAQDTAFPVPSFSAGVATFRRGETAQQLIDRADEALYRAKRGGRDRVEFAGGAMS